MEIKKSSQDRMRELSLGQRQLLCTILRERVRDNGISLKCSGWPLSRGQQRLWFEHHQIDLPATYNVYSVFSLDVLCMEKFSAALKSVVAKHPILRSRIILKLEGLYHKISNNLSLEQYFEFDTLLSEQALYSNINRVLHYRFVLDKAPLFRFYVGFYNELYYIVICFHPIIMDRVSIELLKQDLLDIYFDRFEQAANRNRRNVSYFDYVKREVMLRQSKSYIDKRLLWKAYLADQDFYVPLPGDSNESYQASKSNGRGNRVVLPIDNALQRRIGTALKKYAISHYIFYFTIFFILIYKYTANKNFVIATAVANRRDNKFSQCIGSFVNTILIKSLFDPLDSFTNYIVKQRENILHCLDVQEVLLSDVLADLNNYHPNQLLFNIFYNFTDQRRLSLQLPQVEVKNVAYNHNSAKFPLTLELFLTHDGVSGYFEYAVNRLDEQSVINMRDSFILIIKGVISSPEASIKDITLCSDSLLDVYL